MSFISISNELLVERLIDGILTLYAGLVVYRVFTSTKEVNFTSISFWLDLASHGALIIFLSITLQIMRNEHLDSKISLSTALATLTACLISLVFGISLGRSWASPITENKKSMKKKIQKRLDISNSMISSSQKSIDVSITDRSIMDVVDEAKVLLQSTLGMETKHHHRNNASLREWKLAQTGHSSHIWISKSKNSDSIVKGSAFSPMSVASVVKYLYSNKNYFALDGVAVVNETLQMLNNGRVIVSRLVASPGNNSNGNNLEKKLFYSSNSITNSGANKIEYIVVTTFTEIENGGIMIASKSLPESYTSIHKRKGYVLNNLVISGYVILPVNSNVNPLPSNSVGIAKSRILFVTHMDSSMSKYASSNIDNLIASSLTTLDTLYAILPEYEITEKSNGNSNDNHIGVLETVLAENVLDQYITVTSSQKIELYKISKSLLYRLLMLYNSINNGNNEMEAINVIELFNNSVNYNIIESQENSSNNSNFFNNLLKEVSNQRSCIYDSDCWNVFHEQDDIRLSEYTTGTTGILSAFCHIQVYV
jgi:hypothetical protein